MGIQHLLGVRPGRHRRPSLGNNNNPGSAGTIITTRLTRQSGNYGAAAGQSITQIPENNDMKQLKRAILFAFFVLSCLGALSGCQTAHGFGEDMENTGQKIQEKAQ